MAEKIFNRGLASGKGFCNRAVELAQLHSNIINLTHTFIISPRRYGKTSLALRAIETSKLPAAHIDLFMKSELNPVLQEFYEGCASLASKITKPSEKAIQLIERFLKNIKISLKLGKIGLEYEFTPIQANAAIGFKQLLIGIDELLIKQKQHAIIFIDEIQSIAETELFSEVEGALRFVAQKTKHITFIFSGSSRHLLSEIFEDKNRPFYKLCHKMALERISREHYLRFINKFALAKWKSIFSQEAIQMILDLTELHPYYVNVLCEKLFAINKLPNAIDVIQAWNLTCTEEQGSIARDVEFLTPKQKSLLAAIARHPGLKEVTAKEFIQKLNMTPRGASLGIKTLLRHDLIEKTAEDIFRVVDPILAYWLKN